ncbi:hypothetical protein SGPA1_12684 [Streptomyces misionensis JCM 4497]
MPGTVPCRGRRPSSSNPPGTGTKALPGSKVTVGKLWWASERRLHIPVPGPFPKPHEAPTTGPYHHSPDRR